MSGEAQRIPIEELLLQRHEMLLLDCVHDFGPDHVEVGRHGDSAASAGG